MLNKEIVSGRIIVMGDESHCLGATDILFKIIDVEGSIGINAELSPRELKNPTFGLHHASLVRINPVLEEVGEEVVFFKNMIVMDATDVREQVKGGCSMK